MKKCPFCKADIEDNARFCLYCMKPLNEKEVIPPPQRKKPWWILAVAAAVLIVVLWSLRGSVTPPVGNAGEGSLPTETTQNSSIATTVTQTQPTTDISVTNPPTQNQTEPVQNPTENSEPMTKPAEPPTEVTTKPTVVPTTKPTVAPTEIPTMPATKSPTQAPTKRPTVPATQRPTVVPTTQPTAPTQTKAPTMPALSPTTAQTAAPTKPTEKPTQPSAPAPTTPPSTLPTQTLTEPESSGSEIKYSYRIARAGDDFSANYQNTGNDIVITGVTQPAADGVYDIPSYIDGKKVIAIVANAFSGSDAKVVYVPATVKTIWNGAFSGCNLTDIYFRGNAIYTESNAFSGGVIIHCSASCSDRNFRYYKNSAANYGATWEEWNG